MTGKLDESTTWYAEYVRLGVNKDKYVFHLGSNGYTSIDGRLSKSNAMRTAANRAKKLNATWYGGREDVKGFVIIRASDINGLLNNDETLEIYDLDLRPTGYRVGEVIKERDE